MRTYKKAEKTRKKIMDTFVMLCMRSLGTLPNVSEICSEMDIYRGTFYNYFSGINELVEFLSQDVNKTLELLYEDLLDLEYSDGKILAKTQNPFYRMLKEALCQRNAMVVLLCPDYDFAYRKTTLLMIYNVVDAIFNNYPQNQRHYICAYTSEGVLSAVYDWLYKQDMELKQFSEFVSMLTLESFQSMYNRYIQ